MEGAHDLRASKASLKSLAAKDRQTLPVVYEKRRVLKTATPESALKSKSNSPNKT
jgi:hypothetical protein